MHVLEYWATCCGPCIAAMPHLSDLADKYKDKDTFIGGNVFEKTAGENKLAIEEEEKAIAAAKEEVKVPKFAGRVFEYTITEYEQTLSKYKK